VKGVAILTDALSKGAEIVWEPADRPRLKVPRGMAILFQGEEETTREVLRRAAMFREYLNKPGYSLFFKIPGAKIREGFCSTCGAGPPLGRDAGRCQICNTAASIALGDVLGITPPLENC